MTLIAYARVSSHDQSLDLQIEQLRGAGAEKIFAEKASGTATTHRDQLRDCLAYCREGDVLLVTRMDRIARSLADLVVIMSTLEKKGCGFRCLLQPIDTTSSEGRLMMHLLGAFAEFETALRKERQMEGIRRAKVAGVYRKRKPKADILEQRRLAVLKLRDEDGMGAAEIGRRLDISRNSVYRAVPDGWGPQVGGRPAGVSEIHSPE